MFAFPKISGSALRHQTETLFPGVVIAVIVAISAAFLSDHYGGPAMLMALLLGIAVSFLSEEGRALQGIAFSARTLLRVGVALLGARISFELILALGAGRIALIVAGVALTIGFGLAVVRLFGHGWRFGLLTAGSVAICGASAAMALGAILPSDERSEERLIFTVIGVTVLSTLAMILYPIVTDVLAVNDLDAGYILGGTIHDVAQVVGAGFSISDVSGETATLVKLIRVSLLAPVVLIASLVIRQLHNADTDGTRPPILPGFVVAFLILATVNSLHLIPETLATLLAELSRWLLLIAVAAVGMKTNLKQVLRVGLPAIGLLVTETAFLAVFIMGGLTLIT